MADKKISELVELVTPVTDDELVIVDKSETETKKITAENLRDHTPKSHGNEVHTETFIEGSDVPENEADPSIDDSLKGVTISEVRDHAPQLHATSHKSGGDDSLFIWGTFVFTISGALVVGVDKAPTLAPATAVTIDKVWIYVKTGPSGGVCTVDVNKNGTTIFTDQGKRPSIADGENSDESDTPDVVALAKNDLLTIDVDAANGAEDLTIHVRVKQYLQ